MKALSIRQPWATLIAIGAKKCETRSWSTSHRGPLLIHASNTMTELAKALCHAEPFRSELEKAGYSRPEDLPKGAIVAVTFLADCLRANPGALTWLERCLGDFSRGRWVFKLTQIVRIEPPIQYPFGRLGIFEVNPDTILKGE